MSIPTAVDGVTSVDASLLNSYKTEIETLAGRSVLAGTGLSGGGTLAADRTLALDVSGLTALGAAVDPAADYLPIYDGSGNVVRKVLAGALVPLSAKGDLLTHDGTTPVRLAVGSDGQVLTAQADGSAAWEALPDSGAVIKIASLSGAAASFVFDSIPQSYRSLRMVLDARGDDAGVTSNLRVKCNNDASNLYDYVVHVQNGTNFSFSASAVSQTYFDCGNIPAGGSAAGASSLFDMFFSNYAGTNFHKNAHTNFGSVRSTTAGDNIRIHGEMRYRSTSAITRLDITLGAGAFAAGSVATLYGLT